MNRYFRRFLIESERVAFDSKHRSIIKFNMDKYNAAVLKGKKRIQDLDEIRTFAAQRKRLTLKKLDKFILEFESTISKNGAKVLWAEDNSDIKKHLFDIINENSTSLIVKSKSMTTEEVDFNSIAINRNAKSIETDLGEYIVQVAGEKPYHIVTPAMHKSKKDINDLFNEKFGIGEGRSAEYLTNFVREKLRLYFQEADLGVTGANYLIADIGGVAVTENEGNALFSTSFPKIQIVIAGIEKVIPSVKDLDILWPLLSTNGTGQAITAYNSIFTGPKKGNEEFGPDQMYVILLDNKRTKILGKDKLSNSLSCIRCGSCLNACPIYHNIGGYIYNSTYSGPIGSIITPFLKNFKKYSHLSYACTLCGKCKEKCPVKIDLPEYLLHIRKMRNQSKKLDFFDLGIKLFKIVSMNSFLFKNISYKIMNFCVNRFGNNLFGKRRELPPLKKNFTKSYK